MRVYRATYRSTPSSADRFSCWFAERDEADKFADNARASGRPCSVRAVIVPTNDPAKMLRWLNNNAFVYS